MLANTSVLTDVYYQTEQNISINVHGFSLERSSKGFCTWPHALTPSPELP